MYKWGSDSILVIFHWSKLWKAKFFSYWMMRFSWPNLPVSIEVISIELLAFNEREDELSKLFEFVILCSNFWLKIEVTARQKSVFLVSHKCVLQRVSFIGRCWCFQTWYSRSARKVIDLLLLLRGVIEPFSGKWKLFKVFFSVQCN